MTSRATRQSGPTDDAYARVGALIADRLREKGVALTGRESPEALVHIEEAIERFEAAVKSRGGDLLIDEGVHAPASAPDDVHFALPTRARRDSVAQYIERLERATDLVRHHRRIR